MHDFIVGILFLAAVMAPCALLLSSRPALDSKEAYRNSRRGF